MSFVCHSYVLAYVLVCHSYVIRMCRMFIVCHLYVTRMYPYVIRMSLVSTRMSSVWHSYVVVCHPYVTRMYSYVIRMSLVSTRFKYLSICSGFSISNIISYLYSSIHGGRGVGGAVTVPTDQGYPTLFFNFLFFRQFHQALQRLLQISHPSHYDNGMLLSLISLLSLYVMNPYSSWTYQYSWHISSTS